MKTGKVFKKFQKHNIKSKYCQNKKKQNRRTQKASRVLHFKNQFKNKNFRKSEALRSKTQNRKKKKL